MERAFLADLGPVLAHRVCFFDSTQFEVLAGFSCLRSRDGLPDVTCFRRATNADIDDYKKNADGRFAEPVANYFAAAAQCDVSNADSSHSAPSVLPWLLRWGSRYEVGFAVSLGSRENRDADGMAHHGFAVTTNRMKDKGITGLEFFNIYIERNVRNADDSSERMVIGDWMLTIDDAKSLDDSYTEQMRRQGARAFANYTLFDVLARTPTLGTRQEKLSQLESWQDTVIGALEQNGFEEFTDISESQKADLRRRLIASQSGAWRDMPIQLSERFVIMRSEFDPDCARQDGLMLAVVMAMEPNPDTDSDFGSVGVGIVGADACGSASRTRGFVNDAIATAKADMQSALEQ